jgi:hypothetical protein
MALQGGVFSKLTTLFRAFAIFFYATLGLFETCLTNAFEYHTFADDFEFMAKIIFVKGFVAVFADFLMGLLRARP